MAHASTDFEGLAPPSGATLGTALGFPVSAGPFAGALGTLCAALALLDPTGVPSLPAVLAPAGFGLGALAFVLGRHARSLPALLLGALALAGAGIALLHGEALWLLLAVLFGLLA
ncbi:MAG TPA: hypothetical protein VLL72_12100 [Kiloniellales bacterium]|nr:hypothetical protein [Kiloniellales bacterium]